MDPEGVLVEKEVGDLCSVLVTGRVTKVEEKHSVTIELDSAEVVDDYEDVDQVPLPNEVNDNSPISLP